MLVGSRHRGVGQLRLRPRRGHRRLVRAHRRVLHRVEDHDGALRAPHAVSGDEASTSASRKRAASRATSGGSRRTTTPARRSTSRSSSRASELRNGLGPRVEKMYSYPLDHEALRLRPRSLVDPERRVLAAQPPHARARGAEDRQGRSLVPQASRDRDAVRALESATGVASLSMEGVGLFAHGLMELRLPSSAARRMPGASGMESRSRFRRRRPAHRSHAWRFTLVYCSRAANPIVEDAIERVTLVS